MDEGKDLQAGLHTAERERPRTKTVAETWHTLLLVVIVAGWFYFGQARLLHLQEHVRFSHIAFYLRMILWDSAVVGFVAWGVRRRGGSLRAIIGGRWDSAKEEFAARDAGALVARFHCGIDVDGGEALNE